jgi:hypothetical protein
LDNIAEELISYYVHDIMDHLGEPVVVDKLSFKARRKTNLITIKVP